MEMEELIEVSSCKVTVYTYSCILSSGFCGFLLMLVTI